MEWISVEAELPEDRQFVIVSGGIAYHGRDGRWMTATGCDLPGRPIQWEVTHWMPLPDPPNSRDAERVPGTDLDNQLP